MEGERERGERERNLTFERKREREIGKGTQRRGGFYPNKLIREKTGGHFCRKEIDSRGEKGGYLTKEGLSNKGEELR